MSNVTLGARSSLLLFLAVAACGAPSSQTAPAATTDPAAGAEAASEPAAASGGCIPDAAFAAADGDDPTLGVHALPGPRLCIYEGSPFAGSYRGCWRYDGGGVTPVDSTPRAGVAFYSDSDDGLTVSDGGQVTATIGSERMRITDGGRTVADRPLFSDAEPDGISSQVSEAFLVNRLLIAVDAFAGPHAAVLAFELDGTLIGQIVPEVYGGAVSVLDDHRVGVATASLSAIEVYDTRTRKLAQYERALPALPCTDEQIEEFEVEGVLPCDDEDDEDGADGADGPTRACCDAIKTTRGRYGELGGVAALPGGGFLVAFAGDRLGEVAVVTTDGASATIAREASLRCSREPGE